jgi:spore germination protein YaaH
MVCAPAPKNARPRKTARIAPLSRFSRAAFFLALTSAATAQARPTSRVYGYIAAGTPVSAVRLDLVTDLAFSSEPLATDGTLTTTSWMSAGKTMVTAAHQAGVRVDLVVELMDTTPLETFLGSATAMQKATQQIVAAVQAAGGDGVNLDFEFVPSADKAAFTSFVGGVTTAMHAAIPGSQVGIAIPGTAYPGYDIAGLAAACDTLMIMSYDFHYAGSDPGPVAPLADSKTWGAGSQTSSVALFKGKVADASKLVLGMPLYGYDYHATSSTVPGTHTAGTTATAVSWKDCAPIATMYGKTWDADSSTPFVVYEESGAWRQLFYDDAESLGLKIDLAVSSGVGIGFWSLTYADDDFWGVLAQKLGAPDGGAAGPPGDMATDAADAGAPRDFATTPPAMMAAPRGCSCDLGASHERMNISTNVDGYALGLLILALLLARRHLRVRASR